MEYTVNRTEPTKADIHLTFSSEDIAQAYEKAYQKAASRVKINGFRPGKAPLPMVKKHLGDSVAEDAITILLNETLTNIYPNLEFKPYSQPDIQIEKFEKDSTLVAKASLEIGPEIKIGNYKNLNLQTYEPEIQDSDIEPHLKEIQYALSKTQAKEEGESVEAQDFIELELEGLDAEGVVRQKTEKTSYFLGRIEENRSLEQNFIGIKANEEKEFTHTHEVSHPNPDIAGQTIQYKVKVHSIYKVILPELNDDLAKDYSEELTGLEELKQKLRASVQNNINKQLHDYYVSLLIAEVRKNSEYHFPESLIREETQHVFEKDLKRFGMPKNMEMAEFAKIAGLPEEELKTRMRDKALNNLSNYFSLMEIAKIENMEVGEEEFKAGINRFLESADKKNLSNNALNEAARSIHDSLLFDKVFHFLIDNADKKVDTGINLENTRKILLNPERSQ
jgi:trigger factor